MYKYWAFDPSRNSFIGTQEIKKALPSGLYDLEVTGFGDPKARGLELRKDETCVFKHGPLPKIVDEVNTFWDSADHYKKLGVSHKRGILLYGPPGCGKTGIISAIIHNTIARRGIVFQVTEGGIREFKNAIPLARQIEDGRPIIAIMEDIENIAAYDETSLLEAMDGASSIGDGVLFVATTNHLAKVPPRIRCRPSRIDTLIEIDFPNQAQREEYLDFLTSNNARNQLWAKKTNNFSLAMLKELVLSVDIYKKPLEQSIAVLQEMAKDNCE